MSPGGSHSQDEKRSSWEGDEARASTNEKLDGGMEDRELPHGEETPDVTLEIPALSLEELSLRVGNLRARISLQAELADTVKINVGVDAYVEDLELELKGLEAQALLKVNLDNVRDILGRTLESLDNNPQLLENLAQSGGSMEGVAGKIQDEGEGREGDEESADKINATKTAWSKAEELGVELSQLEGTGSNGRIVVRDVLQAANQK